jgi:cytidylate kinase
LGAHGDAVLIGHGGAFAFDKKRRLSIRITASSDVRAERLARRWKEPMEKIRKRMEESDHEIREFIRYHFNKNRDDLTSYDLVFNTDNLTVNEIVGAVLAILT